MRLEKQERKFFRKRLENFIVKNPHEGKIEETG
jgi:hypothetical protein